MDSGSGAGRKDGAPEDRGAARGGPLEGYGLPRSGPLESGKVRGIIVGQGRVAGGLCSPQGRDAGGDSGDPGSQGQAAGEPTQSNSYTFGHMMPRAGFWREMCNPRAGRRREDTGKHIV